MASEEVVEEGSTGPGEDLAVVHAARGVFAEAPADVLTEVERVGVSLTVHHQQQHPHEAHVGWGIKNTNSTAPS